MTGEGVVHDMGNAMITLAAMSEESGPVNGLTATGSTQFGDGPNVVRTSLAWHVADGCGGSAAADILLQQVHVAAS